MSEFDQPQKTLEQVRGWFADNGVQISSSGARANLLRSFFRREVTEMLGESARIGIIGEQREVKGPSLSLYVLEGQNEAPSGVKKRLYEDFDAKVASLLRSGHTRAELDFVPEESFRQKVEGLSQEGPAKYLGMLDKGEAAVVLIPPGWSPDLRKFTLVPENLEVYPGMVMDCSDERCGASMIFDRFNGGIEQMRGNLATTVHMTIDQIPVFRCIACGVTENHFEALASLMIQAQQTLVDEGIIIKTTPKS